MVELQHRPGGVPELTQFLQQHPNADISLWNDQRFQPVKQRVKAALNQDQQGLCVYCERLLTATEGQLEHIKPKSGTNGQPALCFTYTNYAHGCINPQTCGQKKKDGLLPIEPGPGCNKQWTLSTTDGSLQPVEGLTRRERHQVTQTRDMLGLNKDSTLVADRQRWLNSALEVLKNQPEQLDLFLNQSPFRHLLATVL
ncbi:MAG: TIGR02646 family protein [Marinospirillum sp.]|uniref:retron system putative HNH endonuclease n=1 Tax=Marinospirillum sp. TaxID=2183934 RepID=UPI0019F65A7D|nr:retron system putative HNH endonuclease [Marinospirillum sp.]MBE0507866.1 TIGR02646 family protein [Marinospirillum sp.]